MGCVCLYRPRLCGKVKKGNKKNHIASDVVFLCGVTSGWPCHHQTLSNQLLVSRLFVAQLVRNGEFLTAFCTTGCQNLAAIYGSHTSTETVLVDSFPLGRLISPFHSAI